MKLTDYPLAAESDGTEELLVVQGAPGARVARRMTPAQFAGAGTRPTQAELVTAILATLAGSAAIDVVDNGDGTATIALKPSIDLAGNPTADTPAPGDDSERLATTAFVAAVKALLETAIEGRQAPILEGDNVELVDNGDGTFTLNSTATAAGEELPDGLHGDVDVSTAGGAKVLTIKTGTAVNMTVLDAVYSAAWNSDLHPATRHALYTKLEAMALTIGGKIASTAVGAPNGVAGLDGTGKVPAAQLPAFVDDVLEFNSLAGMPTPGTAGVIYVALDTNKSYRWSGSAYVELTASPGTTDNVPEGATNRYYTDARVRACAATGLAATAGAPTATDSFLTILGKLWQQAYTAIPNGYAALAGADFTGAVAGQTPNSAQSGGFKLKGNATSGYAYLQVTSSAGAQWGYWRHNAAGQAYYSGALYVQGDITSASDRRLKSDIRTIDGALGLVRQLRGARYTMHDKPAKGRKAEGRPSVGVIAQELETVLPELVANNDDGFKSVDYGKLSAVLIEAVKELAAEVDRLKVAAA